MPLLVFGSARHVKKQYVFCPNAVISFLRLYAKSKRFKWYPSRPSSFFSGQYLEKNKKNPPLHHWRFSIYRPLLRKYHENPVLLMPFRHSDHDLWFAIIFLKYLLSSMRYLKNSTRHVTEFFVNFFFFVDQN